MFFHNRDQSCQERCTRKNVPDLCSWKSCLKRMLKDIKMLGFITWPVQVSKVSAYPSLSKTFVFLILAQKAKNDICLTCNDIQIAPTNSGTPSCPLYQQGSIPLPTGSLFTNLFTSSLAKSLQIMTDLPTDSHHQSDHSAPDEPPAPRPVIQTISQREHTDVLFDSIRATDCQWG